ncbi:MAG: Gfo/Idh/MocA family oxidoreductase [Kosmotoga sp.]|nr:MAG: Gfo/Idh/MocA family oxidoreductase [Kosmotoga sp.]
MYVGIIGCGMMGKIHSKAYSEIKGINVKAVASLSEEQSKECAEISSSKIASIDEILHDKEIDIVSICTPTDTHKKIAVEAAKNKKNIFCEKPIALSLKDAREMVEICEENNVLLGVNHVVRFFHAYSKTASLLKDGIIGEAVMARMYRGGVFPKHGWNNWFNELDKSGGVLVDLSIHDFDYLRTIFGEIESVTSRTIKKTPSHPGENRDHALTIIRFENGSLAHVEGSWAEPENAPSKFKTSFEFVGKEGMITYDSDEDSTMRIQTISRKHPAFSTSTPTYSDPYKYHIEQFIKAVKKGKEVPVDGNEAIEALKISLAANKSAETGKSVKLSEVL